jgi:hypothetical protein
VSAWVVIPTDPCLYGFHHVSSWLTRAEYDTKRNRLLADGTTVAQEGSMGGSDSRWAFFATDTVPGGYLYEIADLLDSPAYASFDQLAQLSRNWDGMNGILEISRRGDSEA